MSLRRHVDIISPLQVTLKCTCLAHSEARSTNANDLKIRILSILHMKVSTTPGTERVHNTDGQSNPHEYLLASSVAVLHYANNVRKIFLKISPPHPSTDYCLIPENLQTPIPRFRPAEDLRTLLICQLVHFPDTPVTSTFNYTVRVMTSSTRTRGATLVLSNDVTQ